RADAEFNAAYTAEENTDFVRQECLAALASLPAADQIPNWRGWLSFSLAEYQKWRRYANLAAADAGAEFLDGGVRVEKAEKWYNDGLGQLDGRDRSSFRNVGARENFDRASAELTDNIGNEDTAIKDFYGARMNFEECKLGAPFAHEILL